MAESNKKKSWFARHKVLTVIVVLVVLAIIGSSGGSKSNNSNGGQSNSSSESSSQTKEYRFADRVDKQEKDVEIIVGEAGTVDGVKMTVSKVNYTTSLDQFFTTSDGKTYVVADVVLENTSDKVVSYSQANFRIQTAQGQVLDDKSLLADNALGYGDLVSGGTASGQVVFEVPIEEGHQYMIWKPNSARSDRAIVQVK
ncbi:DUF4352 domain-containing protein [Candidatus Saccharibacteria bacterium]|nr:DUF4352 domain-containing protein [Candidatus Saccharibacteria bacterium]